MNGLDLTPLNATAEHRYKKIAAAPVSMDHLLTGLFIGLYEAPPAQIVLDVHGEIKNTEITLLYIRHSRYNSIPAENLIG